MASSWVVYTSTGGTDYDVTFPYLATSHVLILVDGAATVVNVDWAWLNETRIRFAVAPAAGKIIKIYRATPASTAYASFTAGSSLPSVDLNNDMKQVLYRIQETYEELAALYNGTYGTTPATLDALLGPNANTVIARLVSSEWATATSYTAGDMVRPKTSNGFFYVALETGVSAAAEPVWGTSVSGTTWDGTVLWMCLQEEVLPFWAMCPGEVRPEWFGAANDGTTDDALPLQYAITVATQSDRTLVLHGSYGTETALEAVDDLDMRTNGSATIVALASMNFLLRHAGNLTHTGGRLTLDGDSLTDYAVLHSTSYIPNLENVTVANSLGSGFQWGTDPTGSYDQGQNLSGDGTYKSCRATNCAKAGFHCRNAMWWEAAEVVSAGERRIPTGDNRTGFAYVSQNAGTTDALLEPTWPTTLGGTVDDNGIIWECVEHSNVSFLDCATDGTTGSDFLFGTSGYSKLVRGCGSVRWIGGEFTGGPAALCTCSWMCESTEIAGGYYHDIGRGPTVGIDTRHFSIVGNVVRNCAEIGISIDTIIAFGGLADTPSGGSVVSGNCVDGCFIGIRSSCGDLLITGNNITDCTDTSGWLVTFGTCTNVLVKGNSCIARTVSTNFIAFKANGGCTTLWEDNYTNSTRKTGAYIAVTTAGNVSYERIPTNLVVDSVAQSFTLANQDHLVVVNATASNARIYLPAATDKELIGWTCELWRKDGEAKWAVNVYVEDSDGAINGQTLVKVPSDKGAGARFVNQGSGQYLAQVWNGFPEWYTAVDGDPSPLVHQRSFIKLANTSALNVVAFDNGSPCQEFTVLATTTLTTLVHSTSSLIISSGASVVLKNNEVRRFVFVDSDASIASQIA